VREVGEVGVKQRLFERIGRERREERKGTHNAHVGWGYNKTTYPDVHMASLTRFWT